MSSKAADVLQKVAVVGLLGLTGVLGYTTVVQGDRLVERRHRLNAIVEDIKGRGEVPKFIDGEIVGVKPEDADKI